jgi:hypothetical protein
MKVKASGRSALIVATGLFACFAVPSQAAATADNAAASAKSEDTAATSVASKKSAKHGSRHWKSHADRRPGTVAMKSGADKSAATELADKNSDNSDTIPSWVTNANARLASADTQTGDVKAMAARANEILQDAPDKAAGAQPAAESEVLSADQLNDVDRALHEATPPAPVLLMAAAEAPATPAAPAAPVTAASSNESSAWDQTSLIGKIFIGFGALLTMASAARMFVG